MARKWGHLARRSSDEPLESEKRKPTRRDLWRGALLFSSRPPLPFTAMALLATLIFEYLLSILDISGESGVGFVRRV